MKRKRICKKKVSYDASNGKGKYKNIFFSKPPLSNMLFCCLERFDFFGLKGTIYEKEIYEKEVKEFGILKKLIQTLLF